MSNRHEIRGSAAGSSSSNTGAVPKVRWIQTSIISHVLSLHFSQSVPDGDHQGAGLCGGPGEHHIIFTTDPHISLFVAWLVSWTPRVSPVLLLAAPSLRVNIHKVGQRGHWNNKMKCLGSDSPTKEAHRAE